MAGARRHGREQGKSDPIDALAVARAALANPGLPVATLEGEARELRLLVDHRDDLVAERTRAMNRLRWHLHELDPGTEPAPRSLDRVVVLRALEERLEGVEGMVARIARELVGRIRELTRAIDDLEREITPPGPRGRPDPARPAGLWTAHRRPSSSARSRASAGSPRPPRSPATMARRHCRSGRATSCATACPARAIARSTRALHRIAITQMRLGGPGRAYFEHRRAASDSKTEAIRALRRRISDEVYRRMGHDERFRATPQAVLAAAA